eukprot:1157633-Pelagomonas_calceolata.AAC.7
MGGDGGDNIRFHYGAHRHHGSGHQAADVSHVCMQVSSNQCSTTTWVVAAVMMSVYSKELIGTMPLAPGLLMWAMSACR